MKANDAIPLHCALRLTDIAPLYEGPWAYWGWPPPHTIHIRADGIVDTFEEYPR